MRRRSGNRENRLNDLSGAEWLYWTDTLYLTNYPPDATHALRKAHGAMKPPEVMAEIIRFFTKEGELVLDPLAGVGGTLLGAALTNRRALGFELNPAWVALYEQIKREFVVHHGVLVPRGAAQEAGSPPGPPPAQPGARPIDGEMRQGDCLELIRQVPEASVAAVVTDPPYGCQHGARAFKDETNFHMLNPDEELDFGNAPHLSAYLARMRRLGQEVYRVLQDKRYLVLLVGDRYQQGEYVPLGFLVAEEMRRVGFKFKGLKIWSNQATRRPLKPYAVLSVFVPNISHQNILILRKE